MLIGIGSCTLIDFEDIEFPSGIDSEHVAVANQYSHLGVGFNWLPVYSSNSAHSGINSIWASPGIKGAYDVPMEMVFNPTVQYVQIWVGYPYPIYGNSKYGVVAMTAYDQYGNILSSSTYDVGPRIDTPIIVRSYNPKISKVVLKSLDGNNLGLSIDDVEFHESVPFLEEEANKDLQIERERPGELWKILADITPKDIGPDVTFYPGVGNTS